jgi:hypothetical protein
MKNILLILLLSSCTELSYTEKLPYKEKPLPSKECFYRCLVTTPNGPYLTARQACKQYWKNVPCCLVQQNLSSAPEYTYCRNEYK